MRNLFTMMAISLCGTVAYAQSVISVKDVTMAPGGSEQMEVVIDNPTNYTAFQFDLKLPAGIKVKDIDMKGTYGEDRNFERKLIDESTNTYRFLSYDMKNATLTSDGTVATITLEATEEAETATLEGSDLLVVTPAGESTAQETASATITIGEGELIDLPVGGQTTFVSSKDLNFSELTNVKAFIVTGYDLADGSIWLTRVTDVPANTPIWVSGPKSEQITVPYGKSITYYPENFLVGSATESVNIPAETDDYLNWTLGKDGTVSSRPSGISGFPAKKAYLHLPKKVTSIVGSTQSVSLTAKGNKRAYVSPCDLDFTSADGLKAYSVIGFSNDGTILLNRVMKVSVNTPLFLKGAEEGPYDIPSAEEQMTIANMLKGDATNPTALKVIDGDYTTFVLSKSEGVFNVLGSDVAAFPAGTAYLPLLTAYVNTKSPSRGTNSAFNFVEAEVIKYYLGSTGGEATGIDKFASEIDNAVWYNLKGQRIDTPTRKGLYIKNGKKVVIK